MSAEPTPSTRGCAVATLHWVGFLLLFPATTCAVTAVAGAVIALVLGAGWGDVKDVVSPDTLLGPGFLGLTAILQIAMMAGGAAFLGVFLPPDHEPELSVTLRSEHLADAFAIRRSTWPWLVAAALGAGTVGMLPGWCASRMMELESMLPFVEGMKLVGEALEWTGDPGWFALAFAVAITAPICEELIFRGFLWRAAGYALPQAGVWLATSTLFAAYHLNPIHVVAVLPIGLFLGWVRWWSGSIWPGMVGHFVNNALALGVTVAVGAEAETPLGLSVVGFLFAVACAAVPVALARRDGAST